MKNKVKKLLKEYYATGPETEGFLGLKFKSTNYSDKVKTEILNILLDRHNVSEKAFSDIDNMKNYFDNWADEHLDELTKIISDFERDNERYQYCAEYCISKFFKDTNDISKVFEKSNTNDVITESISLFEKKRYKMKELEKNKIPLTNEERNEVLKAKATWNFGPNGSPSPAVWKSKTSDNEVIYVTNTHRAFATATTLKGAINKYHTKIKQTS